MREKLYSNNKKIKRPKRGLKQKGTRLITVDGVAYSYVQKVILLF